MSALKGPITVRRYTVRDELPAGDILRDRFTKGVRAHSFMAIDPAGALDSSSGWVSLNDGEDTDLTQSKIFFVASGGEQLRLTLRTDTLKPSSSDVRRVAAVRIAKRESSEGRPLSRREKRELKEEVVRELRRRILPKQRLVDVVWHLDSGRIYFWSQSKSVNEIFTSLFVNSFGLKLDIENAVSWASDALDFQSRQAIQPTMELWSGFEGVRPLGTATVEDES